MTEPTAVCCRPAYSATAAEPVESPAKKKNPPGKSRPFGMGFSPDVRRKISGVCGRASFSALYVDAGGADAG